MIYKWYIKLAWRHPEIQGEHVYIFSFRVLGSPGDFPSFRVLGSSVINATDLARSMYEIEHFDLTLISGNVGLDILE